jgi:UTP--glucose-1-phosphate uridylyltransferase
MNKITKAVIPCAGFGTRFLPATKAIPKEMFPIIDIPSLQLICQECVDSGITDILLIVSVSKDCIKEHFSTNERLEDLLKSTNKMELLNMVQSINKMANFHYTIQYVMNGTANAVYLAKDFANGEPFALLYGDDLMYVGNGTPVTKQLIDAYEKTGKLIVGCQSMPREEATKYGVVDPGKVDGRLTEIKGFVEKPPIDKLPSTLASLGRYILTPDIFEVIEKEKDDTKKEQYITDSILTIAKTKGAYAYDFVGRRYDIGDKEGFIEATIEFGLRHKETKEKLKKYLKNLDIDKID